MTCREAERLVMPYINGSITDDELEEFLKHIDQCEECREELEIYFTVSGSWMRGRGPTILRAPWRPPWNCPGSVSIPS